MAAMSLVEPACPIPAIAPADLDGAVEAARAAVGLPVGTRIVAAMSGGVDSTVVAALLARAG
jgi:tRNA-specific 2-thiouridylase